tara:strand:- start:21 stop:302 length:282 start_codon:yes stop_codon:yes gene_type:complete
LETIPVITGPTMEPAPCSSRNSVAISTRDRSLFAFASAAHRPYRLRLVPPKRNMIMAKCPVFWGTTSIPVTATKLQAKAVAEITFTLPMRSAR